MEEPGPLLGKIRQVSKKFSPRYCSIKNQKDEVLSDLDEVLDQWKEVYRQTGFRQGRGTRDKLRMDYGNCTRAAACRASIMDYSKAFYNRPNVDHDLTLSYQVPWSSSSHVLQALYKNQGACVRVNMKHHGLPL